MREETILNYQNLVYKILSHYRNIYNYNRDFEEDYFHDGMLALIQAYDTYKDDNNVPVLSLQILKDDGVTPSIQYDMKK